MNARPLAVAFVGGVTIIIVLLLQVGIMGIRKENEALRKEVRQMLTEARLITSRSAARGASESNASTATSEIDFNCAAPPEARLRAGCWLSGVRAPYMAPLPEGNAEHALSQNGEDLELMRRYFVGRRGGTFLEMGALDGKRFSNSHYFEKALGWRGLLIEGSPDSYKELVRNRPLAVCVHAMVCGEPRRLHWIDRGSGPIRGAWELMTAQFRAKWHPTLTDDDIGAMRTVPCLRLAEIVARFGVWHVDLFSLDVEGAEESVLRTIDFNAFSASVVLLETRQERAAEKVLLDAGYVQDAGIRNNAVFLHPRFKRSLRDTRGNDISKAVGRLDE